MRNTVLGVLSFAAIAITAAPAFAQEQPQPVFPQRHGNVATGICTYSPGRALGRSVAAQAINTQIDAFEAAMQAEFNPAQLQADLAPYESNPSSAPEDLQRRFANYIVRTEQISITEQMQKRALTARLDYGPLAQAYEERGCALLFDSAQYVPGYANPSMDMTPTVTQKLDAMVPTWPAFELVSEQAVVNAMAQAAAQGQ